ncbi:helix-turn-helix domain-containing protein [Corynebacterium sp. NPDC060344]|uniref:helix-turn-helix domain-containing protein n=1 Tax=Corynebacterium sp. NPDC060344 TaxID=3347101 RepID=UPI00365B4589
MVQHIDRRMVLLSARDARALAATILEADLRLGFDVYAPIRKIAYDILAGLPSVPATTETDSPPVTHHEVSEATTVNTAVAARMLDLTPRRVRQLAEKGRLPGAKPAGRWEFNLEDIEVFHDYRE